MEKPPLIDWLSSAPLPRSKLKKLIWINSVNPRDLGISNIALEIVNTLCKYGQAPQELPLSERAPVILHSMHQTGLPHVAGTDTQRTTITHLKEAIYQLLVRHPLPVLKHKALKSLAGTAPGTPKWSLEGLGSLMRCLLDNFPSGSSDIRDPLTALVTPTGQIDDSMQPIF